MYKLTLALTFNEGAGDAQRAKITQNLKDAAARKEVGKSFVSPTMPGVFFGGDVLAHFQFADGAALNAMSPIIDAAVDPAAIANLDRVVYAGAASGVAKPDLKNGVYRTLLLSVDSGASEAALQAFEDDLRSMTRHVPAIRNWQLSRTMSGSGAMPWTHVWEQEYESIDGLMGPYMMHPCHWGMVDRWFDPEFPEGMINPRICHTFVAAPVSVLAT